MTSPVPRINRKSPDYHLHPTAKRIHDEIVDMADKAFIARANDPPPQEDGRMRTTLVYEVKRGGLKGLCTLIARDMIKQGDGKKDNYPTLTQQIVAANLKDMNRDQRRKAVGMALLGHEDGGDVVPAVNSVEYPVLAGTDHIPIVEARPYITVGTRRKLGGTAAAVVVVTNPRRERLMPPTSEYPTFQAFVDEHPIYDGEVSETAADHDHVGQHRSD